MKFARSLTLIGALMVSACGGDKITDPSQNVNVPFATTDLRVGTGAEATTGRSVTVNYTLWLYNAAGTDNKGSLIESSAQPGAGPYTFTVGTPNTIAGFNQSVVGMKVGGLRRATVPPSLAYGSQGNPPTIPPNATLIFEIELVSVQ